MVERHPLVRSCGRFLLWVRSGFPAHSGQKSPEMASRSRSWNRGGYRASRSHEPGELDTTGTASMPDSHRRPLAVPALETAGLLIFKLTAFWGTVAYYRDSQQRVMIMQRLVFLARSIPFL